MLVAVHDCLGGKAPVPEALAHLFRDAGDAGAAEHIIYAKGSAARVWREANVEPLDWETVVPNGADNARRSQAILALISHRSVKLLITGTSDIDEDADRALWCAARKQGIPSHVFIDHPDNLKMRFQDADGSLVLPDHVYVIDEGTKDALRKIGLSQSRIGVCGPMHLERMRRVEKPSSAAIAELRARWGVNDSDRIILFPSACGREMAVLGRPSPHDELAALDRLIADVAAGRPIGGWTFAPETTVLVVRPHPRDTEGKYDGYLRTNAPRVVVSADGPPAAAILAADVVAGLDSLLNLAETLGRPAISLANETTAKIRRA